MNELTEQSQAREDTRRPGKTLIIRGYYGRDNLGDELMKDIFVHELRDPKLRLFIMNSAPESLRRECGLETPEDLITGGVPSFPHAVRRFFRIVSAELFVYGGGTIITDKHGCFHLLENGVYFFARRLLGKKSLLISVGATGFKSRIGLFLARNLIRFSSFAYIRDESSYRLLRKLLGKTKRLVQSADMVLLADSVIPLAGDTLPEKKIGLCLMPYYKATYHREEQDAGLLSSLVEQIREIHRHMPDYAFSLIPIQYGENSDMDAVFSERVCSALCDELQIRLDGGKSSEEKIRALADCEYVISMRLHALMLAKQMGRKVFAIDHNEKIGYFIQRYDTPKHAVSLDEVDSLASVFLRERDTAADTGMLARDRETAKSNLRIIRELLGLEDRQE